MEDLCFTGFTGHAFEESASRLLTLARNRPARELLLWDDTGTPNRSVFHSGATIDDALSVLEFDLSALSRVTCRMGLRAPARPSSMSLGVARLDQASIAGIEGQILWSNDDVRLHAEALEHELRSLACDAAEQLDGLVTVSNEDDDSLIVAGDPLVMIPTVLAACIGEISPAQREALEAAGCTVSTRNAVSLIRMPEREHASPQLCEVLRNWIAHELTSRDVRVEQ